MKTLPIHFQAIVIACALALPGSGGAEEVESIPFSPPHPVKAPVTSWGQAVNPEGDCRFFHSEEELLIHVPGGGRPHDLAAEVNVVNAPRVIQPVKGDFTLQVKIDGRFTPGDESSLPERTGYNGAGLIVMLDERNVVTLARAVLQRQGDAPEPYANFEMRTDGRLERIGLTGDHPLPKTGPVFLRLERRGQKILGAVSADGVSWDALEPKELPGDWPKDLQAGLVAISTSAEEFHPRFSQLQLLK